MAEPFVFHFKPNPSGEPETMYISDILGLCSCCKHEQIQRFYHATSLHRISAENLISLTKNVSKKIDLDCENCGTPFAEEHVLATTMMFGFTDDTGCIVGFHKDNKTQFKFLERKRLDPQALPGFKFSGEEVQIDTPLFEEKIRRVINPKKLWIELFDAMMEDPDGGAWAEASPNYFFVIHDNEEDHAAALETFSDDKSFQIALDNLPGPLPLNNEDNLFASIETWLNPKVIEALENDQLLATAVIPYSKIIKQIKRAFSTANLEFEYEDLVFRNIRTPTDLDFESELSVLAVAERAVYTGLTPGEAARLSAEEIVGTLLRIWR